MMQENIVEIYEKSFRDNWELPALTDYTEGKTTTYGQFARDIAQIHLFFKLAGVKKGDKIALIGRNTPYWVTVFIGSITYGAVIVPILQDFNPRDAQHIINHSDSVLLFAANRIWEQMDLENMPSVRAAISCDNRALLAQQEQETIAALLEQLPAEFEKEYPNGFTAEDIKYERPDNTSLAVINYTSGTTGFSKGVMLTYNNLTGNTVFGMRSKLHFPGSRCLSFLPLAHAYGCAFDMLTPLATGSHITLLGKIPSPKIIVDAMSKVKPDLVICVPLVLEKIYRKMIQPMLSKNMIRWALMVPFLDNKIYAQIRKKLIEAFGGNFSQIIIGGAPFNKEVEDFLRRIEFPFTVGYGMTECAPLISYTYWTDFVPYSAGRVLSGFMEAKITSDDPENIPGEICVKGEHVMQGYYKNPEATAAVLDEEGWLHTGDMGTISRDGTISIRGRYKTMILSSNGQNIYPEEIEAKLNNMTLVMESLVVERDSKLIAIVYPDFEMMDRLGFTSEQLPDEMEKVRKELNKIVAPYEQISKIQLIANEFEKTPKKSIKRYLYTN
ncbi:MAG: AMP-binding protein [Bacteroidales bacterium]|nr:AMP-binding protein [Bacteroidales bacterium]